MITTPTNHRIYFDRGKFDEYCVYHINDKGKKSIPLDEHYFKWIKDLANQYGTDKVYKDFLKIYEISNEDLKENLCLKISNMIDMHYPHEDTTHWWVIFYMTMVAECKKKNAILKKRIKHLGVYNVLFDNYDIAFIISYMRGKKWQELDKLMQERNI